MSEPEQLTYEEAREQLAEIVATLESGDTTLEEALDLWERGERLAAACTRWLHGAQQRLDAAEDAATPTEEEEPSD